MITTLFARAPDEEEQDRRIPRNWIDCLGEFGCGCWRRRQERNAANKEHRHCHWLDPFNNGVALGFFLVIGTASMPRLQRRF